jgi:hypothetical protein
MEAVRLARRYVHPTPNGGRCRIRIYLPDEPESDAPVVICSELSNNPGASITNAAETIAAEVIKGHRLRTPLVWIEHYPAESRRPSAEETFDLVIFSSYEITERALPRRDAAAPWRADLEAPRPRQRGGADRGAAQVAGEPLR